MKKILLLSTAVILCAAGCSSVAGDRPAANSVYYSADASASYEGLISAADIHTRAPGDRTIGEIKDNFLRLIKDTDTPRLLHCADMPEEDLKWLFGESIPVTVTSACGLNFSDGSFIIMLKLEVRRTGENFKLETKQAQMLKAAALDTPLCKGKDIFVDVYGAFCDYGFIGYSKDCAKILRQTAAAARQI